MKDCTYYDLLGVPMDATDDEIASAKNFLVKKFHPDANLNSGFDTTPYIQNILNAYRILSSPNHRRVYDRQIRNPIRRNSGTEPINQDTDSGYVSPNFAPYWEAANKLNELVNESAPFLKSKLLAKYEAPTEKLINIAKEATPRIKTLEDGDIPKEYWHSYAINWLLFQWSQNRDLPYPLLFSMYDSYLEQRKTRVEKYKITSQAAAFSTNLERLMALAIS